MLGVHACGSALEPAGLETRYSIRPTAMGGNRGARDVYESDVMGATTVEWARSAGGRRARDGAMRQRLEGEWGAESGTCIGCGAQGAAFSQCLSCGAPIEPDDGSWHYSFGWVAGPRHQGEARGSMH